MHDEDRPLIGRESKEAPLELIPICYGEQVVGPCWSLQRQDPEIRDAVTLATGLCETDIDEDALEPRIEAVRIAEAAKVTPGDDERVLESVLGPIDVAEDPLGDREQPVTASADQVDVCLPIPTLCRLYQVAIHGSRLSHCARWGRRPNLLVERLASSFNLRFAILGPAAAEGRPWRRGSA
jgi:hypothetical protein